MKVLLVNTNTFRTMSPMPLGLAIVAQGLRDRAHEVQLLDLMFAKAPSTQLRRVLESFRPGVVGFTIRNLDNQEMANPISLLGEIRSYVRLAKLAEIPSVLGGTAFSTFPEAMLRFMEADYGIAGQGEQGMPRLVESLAEGTVDENIDGLVWRDHGVIRSNPPSHPGYRGVVGAWDLLNMRGYRSSMMPAAVLIKTGCPYECSYCDARVTFGTRFHIREPEEIVEDIRRMRDLHRIATFFLVDPCLNAPLSNAKALLEAIIRADLGVHISAVLAPMRGEYDDEMLTLYRRAGGHFAMLGVESFSQRMLESYKKPFDLEDVFNFSSMIQRQGIKFGVNLLIGGPGENDDTLRESLRVFDKIPYSMVIPGFGLRILPHTAVFDTAVDEGVIATAEELFEPKFYFSPQLDREEATVLLNKTVKRYAYRGAGLLPVGLRSLAARYLNIAL